MGKLSDGPVVVALLSRGDFQVRRQNALEANKIHHVFDHLLSFPNLQLLVLGHLDRLEVLPRHKFGAKRFSMFLLQRMLLLAEVMKWAKSSLLNTPTEVLSTDELKESWSKIRFRVWLKLLKKIGATSLIGIGLTKEEILAARELKIKSIEVQHGVFFEGAISYYWPAAKPDFFALWPLRKKQLINSSDMQNITIPFPRFPKIRHKLPSFDFLVPLTCGEIWDSETDFLHGAMPEQVFRLLKTSPYSDSKLRFRIHPSFDKKRKSDLVRNLKSAFKGCTVASYQDESVEDFLSKGSVVLIHESTIWLEAFFAGVSVVTTSLRTHGVMEDFHAYHGFGNHVFAESDATLSYCVQKINGERLNRSNDSSSQIRLWSNWSELNNVIWGK